MYCLLLHILFIPFLSWCFVASAPQGRRQSISSIADADSTFPFIRPACYRQTPSIKPASRMDCFRALEKMPFNPSGILSGQKSFTTTCGSCSVG
ncbi:hypothetical protein CROQUDRAFT_97914 [Cronartium quercuum f. sp. fusiforme G11]|uniref:Secreted protein n=1 Tax=Cronartium quercuum f. sp. fusiforme G11 TaxID=708437 RepID=A0A9P6T7N5_9BASI|nr:hypothetical protein CROQUDRAFT_97914 [Cronartium quercuum f. sp. fusiforme G11]